MDEVERLALASFADRLAGALSALATDLRTAPPAEPSARGRSPRSHTSVEGRPGAGGATRQQAGQEPAGGADGEGALGRQRAPRGSRQQKLLALPALEQVEGLTATQAAKALGWPDSNVYKVIDQLIKAGQVELVPDAVPRAWRKRA